MSVVFHCDDKETLVAYLYGEVNDDVRREVDRHLRTCAACTRETEGLQAMRQDLQAWQPPEPGLEFSIVPRSQAVRPATVLTSSRWSALRAVPAWAGVAAAALFIGVAASLANIQVRSTADGVVVTSGWMQPPAAAPVVVAPATVANDEWRGELARLERTLRSEMAAQHAAAPVATPVRTGANLDPATTAALLHRVEAMIEDSEERQRQELATKLVQADRLWSVRRQSDLLNINRSFGSLQNRTLAVQANQQEMIKQVDHLRRVNFTQPNQ
jgi:putative zinc finger protein